VPVARAQAARSSAAASATTDRRPRAARGGTVRAFVTADRFRRIDYLANLDVLRPSLPDLELAIVLRTTPGAIPAATIAFDALLDATPLAAPLGADPDAPAVIGYTSGTTADPKGVIHTHRSLLAEIRQLAAIQLAGDRPNLIGTPVAHAIGMLGGLLLPIHRGQPVHLTDAWDPEMVLDVMLSDDLVAGSGATVFLLSLREAVHDEGWYASGDIGVLDHEGYLTITDRKKDIIIRGGANISAAKIEELVVRMPEVSEVAVVAAPDPRLGERASAFVRLRPGAGLINLAAVQRRLADAGLARQKWPEELHIVNEFPRTPSGKIKKYALREWLRAEHGGKG
jgi:acyl-CoA synthetase (AMP-forming)/AMP-acid ligase II